MELVTQDRPAEGQRSDGGHILHLGQSRRIDVKLPGVKVQMRQYCWEFKGVGKCFCLHRTNGIKSQGER